MSRSQTKIHFTSNFLDLKLLQIQDCTVQDLYQRTIGAVCSFIKVLIYAYSRTSMCDHLPQTTAYPKHQKFPNLSLKVGTSSKTPPAVRDRDRIWGLTVNDIPLILTSCKRPLDAFYDLYVRCVHCATKNIRRTLVTT